MEIREIDPDEAVFLNLKQEGLSGKLNLNDRLPSFLQKHDRMTYKVPPLPDTKVIITRMAPPRPTPAVPAEAPPRTATLPQARVKVPQASPQIDSVAIKPKIQPIAHLPAQLPKETIVLDDDLEEMIRAGPPYIREPVIQGNAIAGNVTSPQMMIRPDPVPQPIAIADLDVAEIYGTGRGINLPKLKLPSFRRERQELAYEPKTGFNWKGLVPLLIQVAAGIVLVYFGLTLTGSYYQPASRFTGQLAVVFYQYQLGVLVAVVGCLLGYHGFVRAGKL